MNSPQNHYFLLAEARISAVSHHNAEWHFLLEAADGSTQLEAAEIEPETAQDRLELLALVRGLEAIDQPAHVTLITPSRYVSHGLRYGLDNWRDSGWHWESFGQMTPIKNIDLWRRIDQALAIHRVEHKMLRVDAAQVEVPAPHRKTQPVQRKHLPTDSTLASLDRRGVWQSMRSGMASLLHGLGELVSGPTIATPQGS